MAGILAAFTCGLVFAFGLVAGGMTQPSKVVGFLDVTGAWDPSLALVMGGALGTHALLRRFVLARPRPLLAPAFCVPTRSDLDARLVAGAAIFGLGWGLATSWTGWPISSQAAVSSVTCSPRRRTSANARRIISTRKV